MIADSLSARWAERPSCGPASERHPNCRNVYLGCRHAPVSSLSRKEVRREMSTRTWIAYSSGLALVLMSSLLLGTPARAAGRTITANVLLASNGGGVARREWNASNGAVNGVNGYVFVLDPSEIDTEFTLNLASTNTGVGAPSI